MAGAGRGRRVAVLRIAVLAMMGAWGAAAAEAGQEAAPRARPRTSGSVYDSRALERLVATTGSIGPEAPLMAKPPVLQPIPPGGLEAFVASLWPLARAKGVSRATFDAAFSSMTLDEGILKLTRQQAEFSRPIWDYVETGVSPARVETGARKARDLDAVLDRIEARYGVDRRVVLGVWGMETNFGAFTGGKDVIRSLATLAEAGYRGTFFRDQLVTALLILQQGHVAREEMKGSWAGAMGQTQFMPSSFMSYAVDFDGDGHKNIWTSVPDALASTANYLRRHGWTPGLAWGVEVMLPRGFDYGHTAASFPAFAHRGVRRADGRAMPARGEAHLFLPAGWRGPTFLVTANFEAIKRYNNSDAYALAVALLGDRALGAGPLRAAWPVDAPQLSRAQKAELQRRLTGLGFDAGEPDGRIGSKTRATLRSFQHSHGLVPDGYPDMASLEALRTRR
jgi:membrane-bound lytic murein transglycosylase B